MDSRDAMQVALYLGLLAACTPLLGGFMARVFARNPTDKSRRGRLYFGAVFGPEGEGPVSVCMGP